MSHGTIRKVGQIFGRREGNVEDGPRSRKFCKVVPEMKRNLENLQNGSCKINDKEGEGEEETRAEKLGLRSLYKYQRFPTSKIPPLMIIYFPLHNFWDIPILVPPLEILCPKNAPQPFYFPTCKPPSTLVTCSPTLSYKLPLACYHLLTPTLVFMPYSILLIPILYHS